ncbi:hypothetical protein DSO57_1028857 [Entomophthora muscae]|uniref:Uncharacterized protein n=1 Tax=Entomophthora muscae TaxID=34485 RepID=A0ACC2UAY6_9FUNG|nr:hypothetical protein DSO57_1028857 [Entomophthora muscae]
MTTRMTVAPPGRGSHDNDNVSEDITDLTFLQTKSIRNVGLVLQKRLATNACFTRIGARVLVAVNPYVHIEADLDSYVQSLVTPDDQLAPHMYQLAAVVYFHLRRSGIDQSVVFSGDTGSGKSYCLNLFLKFMAAARSKSTKETRLFNNIENIELVLRSFSTAATAYHAEASRVGRYMELQFDARGRTIGVKYLDYLLEKDRVAKVAPGESNFHVFYQMLAGVSSEERSHFHLQDAAHYHYLSGTASPYAPIDLEAQFIALKASLKTLGFNRKSQSQMFQLLASILHLGNIAFVNQGQHNTSEPAVIKNPETLDLAADFLGLLPTTLEGLLTYKSVMIKREMCTVFLDASDAAIQRDDLTKCLYSLLFAWLMEHINSRLCKEAQANFIGLLDLPGFQSKASPESFDTFLVNYSNERLFNYLCFQVFEASNNAYEEDGVQIPLVDYVGNQTAVHLLGKPGSGIVSIIDKQANRAKGPASDAVLMQALARSHGQDPLLELDRTNSLFTIQHFAKSVTYSVSGFMESNRAAIGADFVFTFRGGDDTPVGNPFVAGLFTSDAVATESHPKNSGAIVSAQQPNIPLRQPSMKRERVKTGDGTKAEKPPGAAIQFQMGMDELFDTFDNTEAWFVVCLNANPTRTARRADIDTLALQVERYALHSMATRKEVEYTVCYQHDEFVARYSHVLEAANIDTGLMPIEVLQATKTQFGWESEHMAVGNRFTYLCDGVWRDLEENLSNAERDGFQPTYFGEDTRSFYSDEDYFDRESKISGSQDGDIHLTKAENQLVMDSPDDEDDDKLPKTRTRKSWICFTWCMTWWIPSSFLSCCAGMKLKEVRMAWREKVTLCIIIFLMCTSVVVFIVGINPLICPTRQIFSSYEISSFNTPSKPLVSVNGQVFDLRGLTTHYGTQQAQLTKVYAGNDVSYMFPMQLSSLCQRYDGTAIDETVSLSNTTMGAQDKNAQYHDHRYYRGADYYQPDWYQNAMQRMRLTMKAGDLAVDPTSLAKKAANNYFWVLLNNRVYDLNNYVIGNVYTLTPQSVSAPTTPGYNFMDPNFIDLVRAGSGKDITLAFNKLYAGDSATKAITTQCLNNAFYAGVLDDRQSFRCVFAQYILLALSVFLFAILFVKFLASLQLGSRPEPEDHDKFIICTVPCYTEGEESLRKTIDSLAVLKYDDKRKLLFIIADGMVMGEATTSPHQGSSWISLVPTLPLTRSPSPSYP